MNERATLWMVGLCSPNVLEGGFSEILRLGVRNPEKSADISYVCVLSYQG
jgi:hypothetical protein